MIPFCRIVLTLVSCTFDPSTPRMTPAEAVAMLRESPGLSNRTHVPPPADGPHVVIIQSSPTAGPFGEFPAFTPPRRLDGSYVPDPQTVYGVRPYSLRIPYGFPFVAHRTPYRAASFVPRDRAAYRPRDLREAPIVRERPRAPAAVAIVGAAPMAGGSMSRARGLQERGSRERDKHLISDRAARDPVRP